jgi:carbon storage regulator CsrA
MLVLSRKIGQRIFIRTSSGEEIRVTVTKMRGDVAAIGFEASENIVIDREEIALEKEKTLGKNPPGAALPAPRKTGGTDAEDA